MGKELKTTRSARLVPVVIRAVLLVASLCATTGSSSWADPPHEPVSLISLIAEPEKFDGKLVSVSGYAIFGWETSLLFFSPYDAQEFVSENALWLDTAKSDKTHVKQWRALLDHQTIVVEGTFSFPWRKKGVFGTGYPNGIITDVTDMHLSDIRHPQPTNDNPKPK
jgi:hypothetical protein